MRSTKYLFLALALSLGCGDSDSSDKAPKADAGGKNSKDGGANGASARDGGSGDSEGDSDSGGSDVIDGDDGSGNGNGEPVGGGGTSADAGFPAVDAAAVPLNDAGQLQGSGSCCSAHDTPGCNNADLMVCVCEKVPSCCTTAWTRECTFIVEQKYCQPKVRDCVCDNFDSACCGPKGFTSTCNIIATKQCDAVPGCF